MGDDSPGHTQHSAHRKPAEILSFGHEQHSGKKHHRRPSQRAATAAKNCIAGKATCLGKAESRSFGYDDKYCRKTTRYHYQKKAWHSTVLELKKTHTLVSVKSICRLLGYTPQAYHKKTKRVFTKTLNDALIIEQVRQLRAVQPRCGTRKLLMDLQPFLQQQNIVLGRDYFFELLAVNKLLVRKTKRSVHTTQSKHHFRRYPNLIKGFVPLKAHELWVSDITYIPLKERFAYLFLITDAYSRKIVGFHVSDDMKVSSAVVALKKAFDQKPAATIVIHHSDRGVQYCSQEYVNLLLQNLAMISMTQSGDPLENAMAERVNGILKTELISGSYEDIDKAAAGIAKAITIYNYKRRHSSINYQIPDEVHQQKGPQIRRWKNYYYSAAKKAEKQQAL